MIVFSFLGELSPQNVHVIKLVNSPGLLMPTRTDFCSRPHSVTLVHFHNPLKSKNSPFQSTSPGTNAAGFIRGSLSIKPSSGHIPAVCRIPARQWKGQGCKLIKHTFRSQCRASRLPTAFAFLVAGSDTRPVSRLPRQRLRNAERKRWLTKRPSAFRLLSRWQKACFLLLWGL